MSDFSNLTYISKVLWRGGQAYRIRHYRPIYVKNISFGVIE